MFRSVSKALFRLFLRKEQFEPEVTRALKITIAFILPLLIAHYIGKPIIGILPAITALLLTSAKIEGTFPERLLILFLASLFCSIVGSIGTLAGAYPFTAVLFLAIITGIACMVRGIGDYGQVFGLSGVILFLISLQPPNTLANALNHSLLILLGGGWAIFLNLITRPFQSGTFRLAMAKPWYISSMLMRSISQPNWLRKKELWLNNTEVSLRKSINNILPWVKKRRKKTASIRREILKIVRASSRLGVSALSLHSEIKEAFIEQTPFTIVLKIKKAANSIGYAGEKITDAILSGKTEKINVADKAVKRTAFVVDNLVKAIEIEKLNTNQWIKLLHIVSLFESSQQYLQDGIQMLKRMQNQKEIKSFSQSSNIELRLRQGLKYASLQFQPGSMLLKHSLRVMIMTSLGMTINYFLELERGYWIVLTIMVLLQPEFGNTWEKARDRMVGTLLGGIVGSFILIYGSTIHYSFLIVTIAVCAFLFSYFQVKNYRISVVFITIMLVVMLEVTENIDWTISAFRLLATIIGGLMAVLGAYLLWPDWESLQFPFRISKAIQANKKYLQQIDFELKTKSGFHARVISSRRKVEIENINVEESLKRIRMEPYRLRKKLKNVQKVIDLNKKLTKELNSFSSFLPELKDYTSFEEVHEVIDQLLKALDLLTSGGKKFEMQEIREKIEMDFLVMEAKMELLKESFLEKKGNDTMILSSTFLPYQIIESELKKIVEPIKLMLDLSEE